MIEALGAWILRIAGTAMICAALLSLAPEGRVKRVARTVCGFAAMAALVSICSDFDSHTFSGFLAEYRHDAARLTEKGEENFSEETRLIIEEKCAAYILDKADEFGIRAAASVTAEKHAEGYWYPVSAEISADEDPEARRKLERVIETELGIAPDNVKWSRYE